jgi:hypothetical protein
MAWTSTNLAQLEDAIAAAAIRGYAEVSFAGTHTMRRYSLRELLDLRTEMKAALGAAAGSVSCTFGEFSKG